MEGDGSSRLHGIKQFYEKQYKPLLIIPFAMLVIALIFLGFYYAETGSLINRDISLKGGVSITVPNAESTDINDLKTQLQAAFPQASINTKSVTNIGSGTGFIVDSDITEEQIEPFIDQISTAIGTELEADDYSIEIVGSSLGASFFRQLVSALLIAFVFMGIVVFLYFRSLIPSLAVILAAFSDIVITLAIVNALGVEMSAAGIAAFLMLIGYSVDTDILLSSRILKRTDGSVMERLYGAMQTGLTMAVTTICAIAVALFVTKSAVIQQIMIVLLVGLLVDLVMTWIQNTGILRMYLERKDRVHQ